MIVSDYENSRIFYWKGANDSRTSLFHDLAGLYKSLLNDPEDIYFQRRINDASGWEMNTPGLKSLKEKIEKHWEPHPPASEEQILAIEQELGMKLPDDLREVYKYANGIDSEYGIALWKLGELIAENSNVKEEHAESNWVMPADSFLFFAPEGNGDYYGFPITQAGIGKRVMALEHEDDSRSYSAPDILNLYDFQLEDYEDEDDDDES